MKILTETMIEKLKTLISGGTEDKKLAVLIANHHTENTEVMALMDGLALESSKNDIHIFFEILEQDYAESLPSVQNLEKMDCSDNQLTALPASIGKLKDLELLYCYKNLLTSLPESIGELKKLERLMVWANQLTSLPESIGKLRNLQMLFCYDNQLTSLPESIGELKNMEVLECWANELESLPESLKKIKKLAIYSGGIPQPRKYSC